ncbi:thrombopoietin receptor isoform X1 [Lates calcarifer]|uniref:MPL proto-oncogene, thrombopoietin receptor n=1 Tax=Lates calcarifer TaxID=8187 RepID=A0A4W6FPG1_LATCA|nr:thrombopoietin receptor isoform X1 [Lates calcarifer]
MISPSTMNWPWRWEMLLISVLIQGGFVPGIYCKNGTVSHLSREEVLLLKDEEDPKCFTRTGEDFTCFFEAADSRTYDWKVNIHPSPPIRCDISVQSPEEGTFLHICSFPDTDVQLFMDIHVEVVEHNTNTTLYNRIVNVEDQFLVAPPFNVSLHQNGKIGQLLVLWHTEVPTYCAEMYKIRYSSKGLGEKTKEVGNIHGDVLDSLVPGEETEVQVTVKCAFETTAGHWSSWSHPVRAMVPQSADDVSIMCYTSNLQNITCQWNGSRYGVEKECKPFYKIGLSEEWTECLVHENFTDLFHFNGDESGKFRVKLNCTGTPLSRTFYTQDFTSITIIKTSPPCHLRRAPNTDKLCLEWEAPLPSLGAHLQYEVGYRTSEDEAWMTAFSEGPKTATCLEASMGRKYNVKVRTKPDGSIYSGHWSAWSDVLTCQTTTDIGGLLLVCIPVLMSVTAVILLSMYHNKLKQYFWPPVPNPDKVLQSFLTEISRQKWDPPLRSKLYSEETTTSVVEIMSEDDVSELGKPLEEFTQLLSPGETISSGEQVDGSPGTTVFPDYVTLNKDSVILCPKGNNYMNEKAVEKGVPGVDDELLQAYQCSCTDGSVCVPPCLGSDFLNLSYMHLAEAADRFDCKVTPARGPGNLYTNLPC